MGSVSKYSYGHVQHMQIEIRTHGIYTANDSEQLAALYFHVSWAFAECWISHVRGGGRVQGFTPFSTTRAISKLGEPRKRALQICC